ncbi:MAG: hypothetical protein HC860_21880 [Alkalinema sp. RU_4_3]|nr:hypothetical protein [Alkalinema sp. RU_4_3]
MGDASLLLSCGKAGSQGKGPTVPDRSIGEIYRQQGQALIEGLILFAHDRLQEGQSAAMVFQRLFAKQQREVMA